MTSTEEIAQKALTNAINNRLVDYEKKRYEIVNASENECLALSRDDMTKFANCMEKNEKKLKRDSKAFNFGLIFIMNKTQEYFTKDPKKTSKDYEEDFKPMFNQLFDNKY